MFKKIKKIPVFFKQVREELKKVNWSSRQELMAAVRVVIVVMSLLTGYIFAVDIGLSKLIQLVLK
ncbi:MAG: preprotein translocase subunit SecE [Omnitrophica bacterium]|nr:preprotein translocase subunit SecE [Candidatus Omnitrophota bacterium]